MNKTIVLLSSPMPQMGKDTVGEYLIDRYSFKRFAFADELKNYLFQLGWDGKKDDNGRELLIQFGELCKKIDKAIWVKKVINKIKQEPNPYIVITDLRFSIEKDYITQFANEENYKIIHIGIERGNWSKESIVSEPTQMDYLSFNDMKVLINNSSIKELYEKIDKIINN